MSETRTADGLKAAEMLTELCGWNEPERVQSQQVSIQVDAKMLEELSKGHEQLMAQQNFHEKAVKGI